MANLRRIAINSTAAITAILFIIGALNMPEALQLISYVNDHNSTGMAALVYTAACIVLFMFPLIVGAAVEVPMWESNTRVGSEIAVAVKNARNGWGSLVAVGLGGGMVTALAGWGAVSIICA